MLTPTVPSTHTNAFIETASQGGLQTSRCHVPESSGCFSAQDSGKVLKKDVVGKQWKVTEMLLEEPGPGNILGTEGP